MSKCMVMPLMRADKIKAIGERKESLNAIKKRVIKAKKITKERNKFNE